MKLITLHEHTIAPDLLTGGVVIDAGCRGWGFATDMRDLGETVLSFDLDELLDVPKGIYFFQKALLPRSGEVCVVDTHDLQAKFIANVGRPIEAVGLAEVMAASQSEGMIEIDVLKLDVEGSEYHLLSDRDFQPLPRQISVEFHEHAHLKAHEALFEICVVNLLRLGYVAVQHERDQRHGAGWNYWDSLFVRKDLI
jgi:hypothetical protein